MKKAFTLLVFIAHFGALAQRPDFDSLKTMLSVEQEMVEYNKMLIRYQNLDTSLTPQDFHLLYYGFVAHPNYAPNRKIEEEDDFVQLVNNFEYVEAAKLGKVLFEYDPFNIDLLFGMVLCSDEKEKEAWTYLYRKVCEAIYRSGAGDSQDNTWVVISVQNEYSFLEALGLTAVKLEEINDLIDKFILSYPNDFGLSEVFFDHSEAYYHYQSRK